MNVSDESLDQYIYTRKLSFPPELERRFRDDYFNRSLVANRVGCVAGLVVTVAFGLLDRWAAPRSYPLFWGMRYGLVCTLILACLVFSFTRWYRRLMQPLCTAAALGAMLSIVFMTVFSRRDEMAFLFYIYGLTPVLVFTYAIIRLRFLYAALSTNVPILAYILLMLLKPGMLITRNDYMLFGINCCFILSVDISGMISGYLNEIAFRRFFVIRLLIDKERGISESLLLNILPASVAGRLKKNEKIADYFDNAGVLFADIAGFTPMSSRLTPLQIVDFLNDIFTRFDKLAGKYRLEKIKTIGDAYMVVSGVPEKRENHIEALIDMAIDMREEVRGIRDQSGKPVTIRIGINFGPVIAGVIGMHKFIYDLWGDAVNIASRMESQGVGGEIQVTEAVYELIRKRYDCRFRDTVEVKGKGRMAVYIIDGRKQTGAA